MQRGRLVLGLFSVGVIMGVLSGIAGNMWIEFYLKYLNIESWMLELSSSMITLTLIAACVFLAATQLFRGAETLDTHGAFKVQPDCRLNIPGKFANQLDIGPGDQVNVTLDQNRLVIEKRGTD